MGSGSCASPELPEGVALAGRTGEAALSGGEEIAVRNLFQGLFDFKALFKAHMSGNGYPNRGQQSRHLAPHGRGALAGDAGRGRAAQFR